MNLKFYGAILHDKVVLQTPAAFKAYVKTFEGKQIELTVGSVKKSRSNNQNRYYWGVVVTMLSDETGYSTDEMHDALRMLFLQDRTKKIPTIKSTTDLSTVEFEDYLAKIRQWAAETLNCVIPDPNEVSI